MLLGDLILVIVDYSGGRFIGRTLLQKRIFFLNELLQLGIRFSPHYYGPYSKEVSRSIDNLVAVGFLDEVVESFGYEPIWGETRRYIYKLTDDGREILAGIKEKEGRKLVEVTDCLNVMGSYNQASDYNRLSKAAKVYHIVKAKGPITLQRIKEEADKLGWQLRASGTEMGEIVSFLENLGLIVQESN